jgi:uncharacterized membrane protein (UPF0127 family)
MVLKVKKTLGIIGLMFKKSPPEIPYYIPLPTSDKSIHTLFMNFDIDVLFISGSNHIIDKATIKKGSKYNPQFPQKIVAAIEFKKGGATFYNIGDVIYYEQ